METYSCFFTETRFYSSWRVSMITSSDTQPYWGGMGNKVGAVSHILHRRVLKFREIRWLSKSHTMMNVPISQILLHLIFCGWELMPWRRCLCLKQSSNSPSTICLYISIHDPKYKLLLSRAPQKDHRIPTLSIFRRLITQSTVSQQPF